MRSSVRRAFWPLLALGVLLAGAAAAQQTMQFHQVKGDSVTSITVGPGVVKMVTKSGRVLTMTGEPDSAGRGEAPSPPEALEPPEPPRPSRNRVGDVVRFGGSVHVDADEVVAGNVVALGGNVTIEGEVQGDVVALGGKVRLSSRARVDGDVVAIGGEVERERGAQIGGEIVNAPRVPGAVFALPVLGLIGKTMEAFGALVMMLVLMGVAWALCSWLPERTHTAVQAVRERPAHSFGVGLLAWMLLIPSFIALALILVILCITIIGIPVAAVVALGYGLAIVVLTFWGYTVGAASFGDRVVAGLRRRPARGLTEAAVWGVGLIGVGLALGKLVSGLGLLGLVGGTLVALMWVGSVVALTMGAGALILTQLGGGGAKRIWAQVRSGKATEQPAAATAAPPAAPSPAAGLPRDRLSGQNPSGSGGPAPQP